MPKIQKILAREVIDSRGYPTVEAEVWIENGMMARAMVPSGASTGTYEACELRDQDPTRFLGKGVLKAVHHVNTLICDALVAKEVTEQRKIDALMNELDATPNKSRLGANAILAVSLAVGRAASQAVGLPFYAYLAQLFQRKKLILPVPLMNIINGGKHANNRIQIQELMIVPVQGTFSESLRVGVEVFHHLKKLLEDRHFSTAVGDEGGFAPDLGSDREGLELIVRAIEKAGYRPGEDVFIAIDAASSEFYEQGKYYIDPEKKQALNSQELIHYYKKLAQDFPLISIEDGIAEEDWPAWKDLTDSLGDQIQLVGDDLFVTHTARLKRGIESGIANAILIKPNQIGTLTETCDAISLAQENHYAVVLSHRSGETEDTTIADLAVASGAGQIKTGSVSRSERLAKYNQLLRIEQELKGSAEFLGARVFNR